MKKHILVILSALLICTQIDANEIEKIVGKYFCDAGYFEIKSDSISLFFGDSETAPKLISEKAKYIIDNGFICFSTKSYYGYLLQAPDIIVFLFKNRQSNYIGWETGMKKRLEGSTSPALIPVGVDNVSSALEEIINGKTVKYQPDSRLDFETLPWVPVKAIGQEIMLTIPTENWRDGKEIDGIYLLNGYFAFDRPDLFNKNSKIKKVKIEIDGKSLVVDLEDNSKIKYLKLPIIIKNGFKKVKLKILEVYSGSKYEDVGLSSVMCLYQRP